MAFMLVSSREYRDYQKFGNRVIEPCYGLRMINGVHALIYAEDADKVRAFLRNVLGFKSVDAGHGWLIFALPPAELAAHPLEEGEQARHELYLMCDDLQKTISELKSKGVNCGQVKQAAWGLMTTIEVPGGMQMGLYEPRHQTAIGL
jgi:predicted enzyme related to lactoylglutathione lyase